MDRYIGLDAHASSCTLGVVTPKGRRVGSQMVETNARCLIEAVRQIPGPRHICLEEGTLSERLYEVLSPQGESHPRAFNVARRTTVPGAGNNGRCPSKRRRTACCRGAS